MSSVPNISSNSEVTVIPYHPDFRLYRRHSSTVTLQNGEGQPQLFRFSKFLLMEYSSFFRNMFNIVQPVDHDKTPLVLPNVTADGLAWVLSALRLHIPDTLKWPSQPVLENIMTIVDQYDLEWLVLRLGATRITNSAHALERYAVVTTMEGDVRRAARSIVCFGMDAMNPWTLSLLVDTLEAHNELHKALREWRSACDKFKNYMASRIGWDKSVVEWEQLVCEIESAWHNHEGDSVYSAGLIAVESCDDSVEGYYKTAFNRYIKPFFA